MWTNRTVIALRGKDGVVFAVEDIVKSKLHEKEPYHRIFNVDRHVGMAAAGLVSDGRMVRLFVSLEDSARPCGGMGVGLRGVAVVAAIRHRAAVFSFLSCKEG